MKFARAQIYPFILFDSHVPNAGFCDEYARNQFVWATVCTNYDDQDTAPERQSGRKAQISNITAAKVHFHRRSGRDVYPDAPQTVADVIRTCLGPKSMLKMILDPMGGILCVWK